MSFCFVILYVTIWCKDNKLIIYLSILLDTKKGLGAVVKFLDLLPQLLCWWFAWLSSLLRFYWVSISGIELLGVMYLRFPLAHEYFHGKFGAIERLNLLRALTPLLCQSHRDKCSWNLMSSLYIVLFCKFYVTIWCKDNKLIIYLSIYLKGVIWLVVNIY